jgi:TatD DNase family protein
MVFKIIDSHAHLTCSDCFSDAREMLDRANEAGVQAVINICTGSDSLEKGLQLAKSAQNPFVYCAAATTPHDVAKDGTAFFPIVEKHARAGDLIAIGETGLDYFYTHSPKDIQQIFLRKYLQLATALNLPVIIHCRDAFEDFLMILDEENNKAKKNISGVLHCFTGTQAEALKVLDRGLYISLSGIVTYPKSIELQKVVRNIPRDRLLLETDTPFLAPKTKRGKRNEPAYVVETAKLIAHLLDVPIEEIAEATYRNSKQLFKLDM